MKLIYLLLAVCLLACNQTSDSTTTTYEAQADSTGIEGATQPATPSADSTSTSYSNERFRNVTVQKAGGNTYRVQGQAQVFEAAFSWVVEDRHNELKQGHQMTRAGAPAWGSFDFKVDVQKQEPSSTLMLVLYEVSAKDGSRQYQLPVRLD